jgi:CBS domain-containing protein
MMRASFPLGRFFGVDLRVHITFPLLLLFTCAFSVATTGGISRGIGLWIAVCLAVAVRELARAIAAAYIGLELRAVFLLPIGGVMAFTSKGPRSVQPDARIVSLTGPIANLVLGFLLLGAAYAFDPQVSLFAQPWVGTGHVLRSFIWTQFILGLVSFLPTPSLPSPSMLRSLAPRNASQKAANADAEPSASATPNAARGLLPAFSLGTGLALGMIVGGLVAGSLWLTIAGVFMLLGSQISSATPTNSPEAQAILVREVMLTEYTLLSSSDTLQGALERTIHSLQDVFPVVRGDRLVGSIARQTITERLFVDGDSYLQGIMTRNLQMANPSERLLDALGRAANLGASEFIPVVEDDGFALRMIGILTPQSLNRAVQQVKLARPTQARNARRD